MPYFCMPTAMIVRELVATLDTIQAAKRIVIKYLNHSGKTTTSLRATYPCKPKASTIVVIFASDNSQTFKLQTGDYTLNF